MVACKADIFVLIMSSEIWLYIIAHRMIHIKLKKFVSACYLVFTLRVDIIRMLSSSKEVRVPPKLLSESMLTKRVHTCSGCPGCVS